MMFERDEALKYKDLNSALLEELRLSKERLNKVELESSAWEAKYYNESAEHDKTYDAFNSFRIEIARKSFQEEEKKSAKPKTKRKAK